MGRTDLNIHVIEGFQRADRTRCPSFAPFTVAVLPPVHLAIFLQRFVESLVLNQIAFAIRDLIGHNQTIIREDPHGSFFDAQNKSSPHQGMRNDIAVAFKTDRAVFVDRAVDPPGSVSLILAQREAGVYRSGSSSLQMGYSAGEDIDFGRVLCNLWMPSQTCHQGSEELQALYQAQARETRATFTVQ